MSRTRVLVVDDDPLFGRFAQAALEDLDVQLRIATGVAEAVAELRSSTFDLVITDLMLVGESGAQLLQSLQADPALGGGPRVAVCSAGLTPSVNAELMRLGAWQLLDKPIGVHPLRRCVLDASALASADEPLATARGQQQGEAVKVDVIATYFDGNEDLYRSFREGCTEQFGLDRAEGDRAFAASDVAAMRRLGHTLKSVLRVLGHDEAAETARTLDAACVASEWAEVGTQWSKLRTALGTLSGARDAPPPG